MKVINQRDNQQYELVIETRRALSTDPNILPTRQNVDNCIIWFRAILVNEQNITKVIGNYYTNINDAINDAISTLDDSFYRTGTESTTQTRTRSG